MKGIRIELEKFINVKGKAIFFGEKNPLNTLATNSTLEIFQLMVRYEKRIIILTDKAQFRIQGILASSDICRFLLQGEKCDFCKTFPSHYDQIYSQPVSSIMNTAVIKLRDNSPLFVAVRIMSQHNIGTLPLINKYGDLIGIITERHIAFLLADTKKNVAVKVGDIMTPDVITCSPSNTIGDALNIICQKGFRRLPIVDNDNLVGYLTVKDLLSYFLRENVVQSFQDHNVAPIFNEKVTKIMKSPVITIQSDVSVTKFAQVMKKHNIGATPVVEDGKIIGIITERDIVKAMDFPAKEG